MQLERMTTEHIESIRLIRNKHIQYLRQSKHLNDIEQKDWFLNTKDIYYTIFRKHNAVNVSIIGAVGLTQIDWVSRKAEISLCLINYIPENENESYWNETKSAVEFIKEYGFNILGLHKLYSTVYQYDNKKNNLWNTLKFLKGGTFKDDVFYNGKYYDTTEYYILRG